MKKLLIASALLLLSVVTYKANAQTEKNDWMVGGGFGFNTAKSNSEFKFSPNAGVFVINNLAVGANVVLDFSKSGTNKVTDVGIGPFVRYYFKPDNNSVAPLLHTSFNFLSTRIKDNNYSNTTNGTNFFFGGGIAWFINDNVSFEGIAGYAHSKYKGLDASNGFSMNFGFQVFLHKSQVNRVIKK